MDASRYSLLLRAGWRSLVALFLLMPSLFATSYSLVNLTSVARQADLYTTRPELLLDMDGDGDADIVTSATNSTQVGTVFVNEGNYVFTETPIPGMVGGQGVAAADFDGDGDLDLASATNESISVLKIHLKDNGAWTFSSTTLSTNATYFRYVRQLVACDIDGDGDSDLVSVCWTKVMLYKNDGSGNFTESEVATSSLISIAAGDLDRDGDVDLVGNRSVTAGSYKESRVVVLLNDGEENFSSSEVTISGYEACIENDEGFIHLGDMNGDGDLDVVDAGYYYYTFWGFWIVESSLWTLPNSGNAVFTYNGNISSLSSLNLLTATYTSCDLRDIDQDGDMDIVAAMYGNAETFKVFHNNNNDGTFSEDYFSAYYETTPGANAQMVFATDLYGSGNANPDFIFSNKGYIGIMRPGPNTAPTAVALSASAIAENQAAGTLVGILSATDSDAGDAHGFTLAAGTGDTGNASFTISGNRLLSAGNFNYELVNSYSIRVQADDHNGGTLAQTFVVSVSDVLDNETPTDIATSPSVLTVNENQASGTAVATLSATDLNGSDTFTYTFATGGNDNTSFQVSGATLQTNAIFDYETTHTYTIRLRVTDNGGASYEEDFTVTVGDVNETPTDITLSNNVVIENQDVGTDVGTLVATDVDSGDTATYTLVNGSGSTDNTSFRISNATLQSNAVFDYETKTSYSIRLRITDGASQTFEKSFTIGISNLLENSPPTDIALSAGSVTEAQAVGAVVGTISVTDVDAGDSSTYTLVAGTGDTDNEKFTISGTSLLTNAVLDYETQT
ncbi:MAG: cadherin domain-containing protein, partial [Planctomycetes bacterium]|nr:cadherin domain-containing protein [Planctomycetota bacterium]